MSINRASSLKSKSRSSTLEYFRNSFIKRFESSGKRAKSLGSFKTQSSLQNTEKKSESIVLSDLLGPDLILHDGNGSESSITYKKALVDTDTKVIGLYFGDHSKDKCRGTLAHLKCAYSHLKGVNEENKENEEKVYPIEIVYAPTVHIDEYPDHKSDLREAHGDWLSIKYDDTISDTLMMYYDIDGIPSLIFVNQHAEVLDGNGLASIMTKEPDDVVTEVMLMYRQNTMKHRLHDSEDRVDIGDALETMSPTKSLVTGGQIELEIEELDLEGSGCPCCSVM